MKKVVFFKVLEQGLGKEKKKKEKKIKNLFLGFGNYYYCYLIGISEGLVERIRMVLAAP